MGRPQAAQSLSPIEDVQRPNAQSLPLPRPPPRWLVPGLTPAAWLMPNPLSQCRTPRRVLQVITPSRMSGAEMQLVRMTPHMIARGHDVATIIKSNSPAIGEMHRLGLV